MGLFKGSKPVPNRASNPSRRPVTSASEWLQKKPVNTPESNHAVAMTKWKSDNSNAQNSDISSSSMIKGIDKSIAEQRIKKSTYNSINKEENKRM